MNKLNPLDNNLHGPHLHKHCEHCRHFCNECSVSYCCSCGRRWYGVIPQWDSHFPSLLGTTDVPYSPNTLEYKMACSDNLAAHDHK